MMNYVGFGIGLIGSLMGAGAAFYQRYGYFGVTIGGPYAVTLAVALLGLLGAILVLFRRYRLGAWITLAACIAGAFTSYELWLAAGSFFLGCCLIGFTNHQTRNV